MSGHPLRDKMGGGRPPEKPEDGSEEATPEEQRGIAGQEAPAPSDTIDTRPVDPDIEAAMQDPLGPSFRVFKKATVALPSDLEDDPSLKTGAAHDLAPGSDEDRAPPTLDAERFEEEEAAISTGAPIDEDPLELDPALEHEVYDERHEAPPQTDWDRHAEESEAALVEADHEPYHEAQAAYEEPEAIESDPVDWTVDPTAYVETVEDVPSTAGGRRLLAAILLTLGVAWLAFAGWSAGRALAGDGIDAPQVALWVSAAMVPLILLALVWMMFGRTRRREAEAFTHQVALMRAEADALDRRLTSMSHNLGSNRHRLGELASELENRADTAALRLSAIGSDLEREAGRLAQHGSSLDRSASAARADMTALIDALPEAEEKVGRMSEKLQGATRSAAEDSERLEQAIRHLGELAGETEERLRTAGGGLADQMSAMQQLGGESFSRVEQARQATADMVDDLLQRSASALSEINDGLSAQANAVDALIERARGGAEDIGGGAVANLHRELEVSEARLSRLGEQVRERDEQARLMISGLDEGLGSLENRFERLGSEGDARAERITGVLQNVREQLAATLEESREQDGMLETLSSRSDGIRDTLTQLSHFLNQQLAGDIGGAQDAMERLGSTGDTLRPQLAAMREDADAATGSIDQTSNRIEESRTALAALVESAGSGTGEVQAKLAELQQSITIVQDDARSLSAETGPALVDALVKVQEASARAREAAREAIAKAIPEAAGQLSAEARKALQNAVEDVVMRQMKELDTLSARAVDAARGASDRLSAQMLSIGQTAAALEDHMAQIDEQGREAQSERFTHQVSLLMESLNSAAIDVEKILSDDVDDKSWASYLKGERGVFTRKAVRLLSQGEAREIGDIYDSDPEFRGAVNRFIHDFEAMLRRVLAERDGGMIGVTLMSSDMGKLYAALAQAVERKVGR